MDGSDDPNHLLGQGFRENVVKRKYIILHSDGSALSFGFESLGLSAGDDAPRIEVDYDDLDERQAAAMNARSDVVAAPAVELALLEPRNTSPADLTETAWGLEAVGALASPFDGSGTTVAILDTGIDRDHEAFRGISVETKNFTGDVEHDVHGHGTHCAGTIFGRAVGGKRIGVAPGVRRALVAKVIGSKGASTDHLLEAIEWAADSGATVINMSLGIDFPELVSKWRIQGIPEKQAISKVLVDYRDTVHLFGLLRTLLAARVGRTRVPLLVAATGNESRRSAVQPFTIAASPPSASEGFLPVAALGRQADGYSVADFSNTGALVAGPGVAVLSAAAGGGLRSMDGTSMAAPHVAGVAALWWQKLLADKQPDTDLLSARLRALATRDGIDVKFTSDDYGSGLVQAPTERS